MKTGKRNSTGANGGNGEENLCSLRFLLFKSGSGGVVELDFDKSISDGVNMNPESFRGDFVFLGWDFETFGEHHRVDSGIFDFMRALPEELARRGVAFQTPSELIEHYSKAGCAYHLPLSSIRQHGQGKVVWSFSLVMMHKELSFN